MALIIAEIGVNWDGDLVLVKDMIKKSKDAGCNAVKFQAFEEQQIKGHPESNRLLKSTISKYNIEQINQIAKQIGMEWFCTPMYPDAVEMLNPFVKRFKIRELDGRPLLENKTTPLIKKILGTKKQIIISSFQSPKNSKFYNQPLIKWLYCVPRYPCTIDELDFNKIKDFNGYSNHCTQIIAPLTAAILGAEIIEIHITSDKKKDYADNNVSFDYLELFDLVKNIRLAEIIKK